MPRLNVPPLPAAAVGHANPKVREDTLQWLAQAIRREAKQNLKALVPTLLSAASKCADEATPAMREAAMGFMAAFAAKVRAVAWL